VEQARSAIRSLRAQGYLRTREGKAKRCR
jgi:hypothetical protein